MPLLSKDSPGRVLSRGWEKEAEPLALPHASPFLVVTSQEFYRKGIQF